MKTLPCKGTLNPGDVLVTRYRVNYSYLAERYTGKKFTRADSISCATVDEAERKIAKLKEQHSGKRLAIGEIIAYQTATGSCSQFTS